MENNKIASLEQNCFDKLKRKTAVPPLASLEQNCEIKDHTEAIWSVFWSNDRKTLVTSSSDRKTNIYNFCESSKTISFTETLPQEHSKTVRSTCISWDNSLLACASFDSTVSIWLLNDSVFECVSKIEGHENEVKSLDFHKHKNYLATCSRDKTIWIWEYNEDFEFFCVSIINAHQQDVKKVKWIHEKDLLASCSYDETIKIWKQDEEDEEEFYCLQEFKQHKGTVWDVAFDLEGNKMFTCSEDKSVCFYFWINNKFEFVDQFQNLHYRDIYSLVFDNLNEFLFTVF